MDFNIKPINIFDFDGTLTTETWPKFWVWAKKLGYNGEKRNDDLEKAIFEYGKDKGGNTLENFFGFFNQLLINNNEVVTYEEMMAGEKYIEYNPGVKDFIRESIAKNYIVSGGLKEFLQRLEVAQFFEGIYGTPVKQDNKGDIIGIGEVMTDDKKLLAICNILQENNRKGTDCRNVYYVGDGYSDAPAMRFVHNNGGKAIFVYQPHKDDAYYDYNNKIYQALNSEGIVDFACIADYSKGSILENILQRQNEKLI